ncbi:hypothetical protein N7462_006491 [Penicillium macrosclerotiorum]|uniref:uncharacterized protein n=1 Tax=Penicillium macrosclerotiorum TaxID=303699 RepID=UPI00254786C9|nr:uncharacterized protein N7462_006491 [Penicillium macrosclerotiorum]KAJ5683326.1 hypothetical protein N7462_006491 [Penicillium macrosclerotiorum]
MTNNLRLAGASISRVRWRAMGIGPLYETRRKIFDGAATHKPVLNAEDATRTWENPDPRFQLLSTGIGATR